MGRVRITGGRYVRRMVVVPPGEIRPAMDRMRVSLFAALGDLEGCSFLDLFSGSGIIGIEAASRGAAPVLLVESDAGKRKTILSNISIVQTEIGLVVMSAERYIETAMGRKFDIVFLDPPFRYADKPALVRGLAENGIVGEGGIVLVHFPSEEDFPDEIGRMTGYDRRVYGRSTVVFLRGR